MKEHGNILNRIALAADLPGETVPGQPIIEIAGGNRLLIENHKGVTVYGCKTIHVKVSYGQVCICGSGLQMARMTKQQLVITGRIDSVSLLRGRK